MYKKKVETHFKLLKKVATVFDVFECCPKIKSFYWLSNVTSTL